MAESLKKKFGQRVRQIRQSLGWTQEQFAERAGLDHKYAGAVERGERNLTISNIEKIAKGFSIEPYQLFLFSLEKGRLQNQVDISKEKIYDLFERCDEKTRTLLLKISQDVASWGKI